MSEFRGPVKNKKMLLGLGLDMAIAVAVAVAVFNTRSVKGEVIFTQRKGGILVEATFTQLEGLHGFHIPSNL